MSEVRQWTAKNLIREVRHHNPSNQQKKPFPRTAMHLWMHARGSSWMPAMNLPLLHPSPLGRGCFEWLITAWIPSPVSIFLLCSSTQCSTWIFTNWQGAITKDYLIVDYYCKFEFQYLIKLSDLITIICLDYGTDYLVGYLGLPTCLLCDMTGW